MSLLINSGLLNDVVNVYDQTKTTIAGRVSQKTFSGQNYLGPPLTKFHDVFTDVGFAPSGIVKTSNNRIFVSFLVAAGTFGIALYNHDPLTNIETYVGQVRFLVPNTAATTHTLRAIKVVDTGTTGWKIFITTTGSVLINGGQLLVNSVDLADFTPIPGAALPFASGNNQKAVYFLQDGANIGVGQLNTASAGAVLDSANNKLYVHNGVAATHQYYVYDTSAAPTYATSSVSVSVASPGIVIDIGHTFVANTPVVFTAGTLPTGLVVGTVYFVRNPIAAVSYELSATSGGALINTTGSPSVGAVIGRAFGTTGSNFLFKTGNLPALTGTLVLIDSEDYALPLHTTNSGFPCAFFPTSTNLYLGKLSELTAGVTAWPSLVTSNILGTANQITTPTLAIASWSNTLDAAVFVTNANKLVMKQVVNNVIQFIFGSQINTYYEGIAVPDSVPIGLVTMNGMDLEDGVLYITGTTVGQRGFITADLHSDSYYDYSYIITPVLNTPSSTLSMLSSLQALAEHTGSIKVQYRTSGFGSAVGGWVDLPLNADLSGFASGSQIQFKILFNIMSGGTTDAAVSSPAQIHELSIGIQSLSEISSHWEFSDDWSDNTSPSRTTFRLKELYPSVVPQLYYRAHDLTDALLITNNTVTDIAKFDYSTDSGNTWIPMGTVPNVVGTFIRYTFTSPPGVDIRPSIRES